MPRCLVTGHRGYIGSRLFKKLESLGHEVIGIDLKDGDDINLILSPNEIKNSKYYRFKPEYIFHMACNPRVEYSVKNPIETAKNNIISTTNVLNFSKSVGAKRLIFSSSSAIYGDGTKPLNPYGLQKLYSEMECNLWKTNLYNLDTVSLRYFNVYSHDQIVSDAYATVIANWIDLIKSDKTPFINGDGEHRRDMVHVDDVVSANLFAMSDNVNFDADYYDVGTGINISLNEIKRIVNKWLPEVEFIYKDERSGDVKKTLADIKPLKKLGWQAKISPEEGINSCFKKLFQYKSGLGRAAMRNQAWGC